LFHHRPLSRAAIHFSVWLGSILAGEPARRYKFGWRQRRDFPAAVARRGQRRFFLYSEFKVGNRYTVKLR